MSRKSPFNTTQNIFTDRDVFDVEGFQPEELIERDEQINEYASALEPVLNGWRPNNIFIYGKTGTGKTATTRYMLDWLRRDVRSHNEDRDGDEIDLSIVYLNCEALTSSYQVAVELLNELRDDHNQVATRGHAPSDIYNWLFEELDEIGGVVLTVLDEVDNVGDDDTILYKLSRPEIENATLGVVGISNDFSFRDDLSAKVKDSLCEKEILFPAYESEELREILFQRAEKGLHADAYDTAPVALSAAYAAQDKGSARQAIDILREAGDIARREDADEITEEHVEEAKGVVERGRVSEMIQGLSPHGQYALHALAIAERRDETPIRTKDLYEFYGSICNQHATDPLSARALRDHMSEIDLIGLATVDKKNAGRAGGKYKQYELDVKVDRVVEAFAETDAVEVDENSYQSTL
ncbi:orc1/cdc6 family replication initiation protein [Natronoarchaeum rubrum]|uniref:orc1/cdc6 family replication initiation protein n=1 Tax=Natronoarchaeum rubrum TaxID=755311 RepID=UPI0021113AB4|nr:orc1/cdc6 family replication initiation protein [Natronoarchaeum rubrum]HMB50911.1 orc1/cdc6 family replication initiation protein [Natronoarchaeum rubrum]